MQPNRPLALVTGASSGIGRTFAQMLAERGYNLVLVARRKDLLAEIAADLTARYGCSAQPIAADLTADSDLAVVEKRIESASDLALLVNNAGFGTKGFFASAKLDGQNQMHRLHVLATMRLTHAALRGMVPRDSGAIINVSSVAGFGVS